MQQEYCLLFLVECHSLAQKLHQLSTFYSHTKLLYHFIWTMGRDQLISVFLYYGYKCHFKGRTWGSGINLLLECCTFCYCKYVAKAMLCVDKSHFRSVNNQKKKKSCYPLSMFASYTQWDHHHHLFFLYLLKFILILL